MEEVGEIAKAILGDEDWRDSAVQSAAVLVAWLEVREVPADSGCDRDETHPSEA